MDTAGATFIKFGVMPRYKPLGPSVRSMCLNNPVMVSLGHTSAETKTIQMFTVVVYHMDLESEIKMYK